MIALKWKYQKEECNVQPNINYGQVDCTDVTIDVIACNISTYATFVIF